MFVQPTEAFERGCRIPGRSCAVPFAKHLRQREILEADLAQIDFRAFPKP